MSIAGARRGNTCAEAVRLTDRIGVLVGSYLGASPKIRRGLAYAGKGAAIVGRTSIGHGARLGSFAVIRADGHYIEIGDDFQLGEHATVHIAHDVYPTLIGNRVSAGPGSVIHACTVGDDCAVGREVVILDGSIIGTGAVIASGSVIYPRSRLEGGWLYAGMPAKPVARVTAAELVAYHEKVRTNLAGLQDGDSDIPAHSLDCFVAPSARVKGDVRVQEGVSIWYGCRIDAGAQRIEIGAGTNVQDNSAVISRDSVVTIGPDVTIGHNVTIIDCRIESGSLIGIGSKIAAGSIVENDVLVAAGTESQPGQRLTAGSIWAGRPARQIRPIDAKLREMLNQTITIYQKYADDFSSMRHWQLP